MKRWAGNGGVWAAVAATVVAAGVARAGDEAEWIWTPSQPRNEAPAGDCYFRKTFDCAAVEEAFVQISADNKFVLTVNGQPAGEGVDWRQMQVIDVTKLLRAGRNVIAVKATNTDAGPAGLTARVLVKQRGGAFEGYSTDATWRTSVRQFPGWTLAEFNDADWVPAASYGLLGDALPWGNEAVTAGEGTRFNVGSEFAVERLMRDDEVGSLIAMTFDARGNVLASREGGSLQLLVDATGDGAHDKATVFCDQIKNCQGLLALGTRVFAVGEGPEGMGLYRLRDADRNGAAEEIVKLIGFRGSRGEHGAHAVRLGPDGMIYVIVGDFARADAKALDRSPYRRWYEGDLVQPRYEDAGGHEVGIPAPGGTVFRTDANGSFVELVAGGLRNSYDLAFNLEGELFAYDADMEWDRGAPWYRPTRVNHLPPGAELGWRSGWAKWPSYYHDSLPAAMNVGAGSPTGVEFYDHYAYPAKYRGAMFGCDWATGRIYAVTFQQRGASYQGKAETFLEGRPLNVTDCAVGPDGALYFCTGGRGTDGGLYRVRWTGKIPPELADPGTGLVRALRQPQLDADWARAQAAAVKQSLGDQWAPQLAAVAREAKRPARVRMRAVDLLVCFGPRPDDALLQDLAGDADPALRAKAARLMYQSDDAATRAALVKLLSDGDAMVRRCACESLARRGALPAAGVVLPLLADEDRFVAFAARRLIERLPVETWAREALDATDPQTFAYGAAALVSLEQNPATSQAALERCLAWLAPPATGAAASRPLSDGQRLDVLRVMQLALIHGKLGAAEAPTLGPALLAMYPTTERRANRELVRLLVHLQTPGAADKFAVELGKEIPFKEKLQIGAYAARLEAGWTTAAKLKLLAFYEQARQVEGGYSVDKYIENFARDFLTRLTISERQHILAGGEKWPATALSTIARLPEQPGADILAELRALDRRVAPLCGQSDAYRRLRVGIVATLGAAEDAESQAYLRKVYQTEPEYRGPVAMSLAQHPTGENWPLLVDAVRASEGMATVEIMSALTRAPQTPTDAAAFRSAILAGLRLGADGAPAALELLAHWHAGPVGARQSGSTLVEAGATAGGDSWRRRLAAWQQWYAERFPEAPPAELPADSGQDKWSYGELLMYLESDAGRRGDAARGQAVFAAAKCASCHRVGSSGETAGPDLTAVAQRFQRKEILQSIVFPSHDISDQYASRVVTAGGKSYVGLVTPHGPTGVVVLLPTGEKAEVAHEDIDDIRPSGVSAMPTGLLNALSLEQVADLFAYLGAGGETSVADRGAAAAR